MTEQEQLWYELETAMLPKKKVNEAPGKCNFCQKETTKLTHESVGGVNIYLCESCLNILKQSRERLNKPDDSEQ